MPKMSRQRHLVTRAMATLNLLLLGTRPGLAQSQAWNGAARLPALSGTLAVGRAEFTWVDSTRTEPFAPSLSTRRQLVVHVWYPAEDGSSNETADYIPHLTAIAAAIGDSAMDSEFGIARSAIATGQVRSQSHDNARMKRAGRPFPTLIFSPGFGESSLTYTAQLEDLASHGYIVIGIEHPFDTYAVLLAGGRVIPFAKASWDSATARPKGAAAWQLAQVPLRAADAVRTEPARTPRNHGGRDRPRECRGPGRIGAFGHSLGGMAVAGACRTDARIRACMNQDADYEGRPFDGGAAAFSLKQPFLFFATGNSIYLSPHTVPPTDSALGLMKMTRAQYDSIVGRYQHNQDAALGSMPGGAVRIEAEAEDFTHRTFIDLKLLQASDSISIAHQTAYLRLIREYVREFFDESLRGMTAPLLRGHGVVDSLLTIEHFGKH
jgi:hypothetical protein